MEKAAGEDENEIAGEKIAAPIAGASAAPNLKKRKRTRTKKTATVGASSGTVAAGDSDSESESDDVVVGTNVVAPQLVHPDVAYLATASLRRKHEQEHPASGYHGFHLAGAGFTGGSNGDAPPPVRSLAGWRYLGTEFVNTCNGVLLLATKGFSDPCRCTLWNPAIADAAREATVPKPPPEERSVPTMLSDDDNKGKNSSRGIETKLWDKKTEFQALGLGYGQGSETYKLLLCRKDKSRISKFWGPIVPGKQRGHVTGGARHQFEYSLVVHSLGRGSRGGGGKETLPLRSVLAMGTVLSYKEEVKEEIIESKSLYVDGTIYVLYLNLKEDVKKLLAFDVDDETVHTIDMPGDLENADYQLVEMNDGHRPCLVVTEEHCIALWMLTADYQLEPTHVISYELTEWYLRSIAGVWDCGSVLLLLLNSCSMTDMILVYDVTAKKIFRADLPGDLRVEKSGYMLCWGYKRTLVSPRSIVGDLSQDMERRRSRSAHITEVIDPLVLRNRRKGQKATMNTACLMEFLVRIMQKLPHDLQDVVEMPSMDSEEPDLLFQNVVRCSD